MSRRSVGPFNGTHLTVITLAIIAVLGVPSALFAVDTFSNVALQDPVSGNKVSVDAQHRVLTRVAGSVTATETAPANLVRFQAQSINFACTAAYTAPAGKALILTDATALVQGAPNSETDLYTDPSCTNVVAGFTSNESRTTITQTLGEGVALQTLFIKTPFGAGVVNGYGYLVSANALP